MSLSSRRSRCITPWDGIEDVDKTPLQRFLQDRYTAIYDDKHLPLAQSSEAALINSYVPTCCPYCGSERFIQKAGYANNNVQRYYCGSCKHYFTPTTGTVFQDHKISISEWCEYTLNVIRYLSINADSWNNRNAFTTSRYWFEKLMIVLEEDKNGLVLSGDVAMDETYYAVSSDEIQHNSSGAKLHGISRNQICIEVACSKEATYCAVLGLGKPTSDLVYEAMKDHIAPGATLIHDKEKSHNLLVKQLGLVSRAYAASTLKGLPDNKNPLRRVNEVHARLKNFLYSHNSFNRDKIQGMLDLFCFVSNPPTDPLLKVEHLINLAFITARTLQYRDFYNVKKPEPLVPVF